MDGHAVVSDLTAAKVLVEHLFARGNASIAGVEYAVGYQLAHRLTGGDIVDVYHFDNDAVAFSIADISGKGTEAAIHAAMVKYGLRAYASQGQTPESVLRSTDRLYIENNAFEKIESFASPRPRSPRAPTVTVDPANKCPTGERGRSSRPESYQAGSFPKSSAPRLRSRRYDTTRSR